MDMFIVLSPAGEDVVFCLATASILLWIKSGTLGAFITIILSALLSGAVVGLLLPESAAWGFGAIVGLGVGFATYYRPFEKVLAIFIASTIGATTATVVSSVGVLSSGMLGWSIFNLALCTTGVMVHHMVLRRLRLW